MAFEIMDGKGRGRLVAVSAENELHVIAQSISRLAHVSEYDGVAFSISSDFVPLTTTGSYNGVLYVLNTATDKHLFVHKMRTSSTVLAKWKCLRKPTAGTLISDAVAAHTNNARTSSAVALAATSYRASANGKTVTDGAHWFQFVTNPIAELDLDGALILGPSDALALSCQPSASGDVGVTLLVTQSNLLAI